MSTPKQVLLVGDGYLFREVRDLLSSDIEVRASETWSTELLQQANCVVSLRDSIQLQDELALQRACRSHGIPYLHGRIENALGMIGPWVEPSQSGCLACSEERRMKVLGQTQKELLRSVQIQPEEATRKQLHVVPFVHSLAQMVVDELARFEQGHTPLLLRSVYVLLAQGLNGKVHSFLPVPACSECSTMPEDSAELATIVLQDRIKNQPWDFRVTNPHLTLEFLREKLFDWRLGMVPHVFRVANSPAVPFCASELPLDNTDDRENGIGRTFTFRDSEFTAILEALERYAGCSPQGKRTVVRGSYEQLKEQAINPEILGLHHPDLYDHPEFPLVPYDPSLVCNWVWGYSFKEQASKLVPEQVAYYRLAPIDPNFRNERFIYEISNGCAMGSSREEAILYGLLEVIERDAFLLAWYGQLGLTEIELDDLNNPNILMMKERIEALGYHVHLFDMTSDLGIPSVWAIVVNPTDEGIKTYSAAGAHFDPEKAILGALVEVGTSVPVYEKDLPGKRDDALEMLLHEEKIKTIDDHVLLYTIPESFHRFDFLLRSDRKKASAREVYQKWYDYQPSMNLTEDVQRLIDHVLAQPGMDVIVVDQTTLEQQELGLVTVKVIVAGTLAMTFGALLHRTYGNQRLLNVPYQLGYWDRPKRYEELQIVPHPFP